MATTYDQTKIINMALSRLGVEAISEIGEDTQGARVMNINFNIVRDSFLEDHYWNFSIKRVTLASQVTAPNHEYDYAFPLPDDFLRVVRLDYEAEGFSYKWRVEIVNDVKCIVTNVATLKMEYVAEITDYNLWSRSAIDAFAQRLAAEVAFQLTGSASIAKQHWDIYEAKLAAARTRDAQEGKPRAFTGDQWILAREAGVMPDES